MWRALATRRASARKRPLARYLRRLICHQPGQHRARAPLVAALSTASLLWRQARLTRREADNSVVIVAPQKVNERNGKRGEISSIWELDRDSKSCMVTPEIEDGEKEEQKNAHVRR